LTEIKFYKQSGEAIQATFKSQSSCYGCTSCETCQHRYGNPLKQFDGDGNSSGEEAWTCTAPGTFVNSLGSQNVVFTLPERPARFVLARPSIDGDWVARDWSMEEQQNDGTWWIIAQVADGPKSNLQGVDVPLTGGQPLYDTIDLGAGWTYDAQDTWATAYPDCGGLEQSPIEIATTEAQPGVPTQPLPYLYEPLSLRTVYNSGLNIQVGGNFGNLTLPGGIYDVLQFHLHLPAEHKIKRGEVNELSVGELHIVHRKRGSRGPNDLVKVAIMLRLPREHEDLVGTEPFFMQLLENGIPVDGGHGMPMNKSVNLSVFDENLQSSYFAYQGSVTTPPCTENVQWYVMSKPAVISGVNVMTLKSKFPNPMNNRHTQLLNGRVPAHSEVLPYRAPAPAPESA
jgi:carbonic anhydrase